MMQQSLLKPPRPAGQNSGERTHQVFGRQLAVMSDGHRDEWIEAAFLYWRQNGFPYPSLTDKEVREEYQRLILTDSSRVLQGSSLQFSSVGLQLANFFHPQMWSARQGDHKRSPLDHFNDDEVLRKLLRRAIRFWPNRRCWNAQCVRSLFRMYSGGRVANFRPTAAKALAAAYSGNGDTILDFSSGYGGRLLGITALRRNYIGIDVDTAQYDGSLGMWNAVRDFAPGNCELHRRCAIDALKAFYKSSIDMILTSPPYFRTEVYSEHPDQSCMKFSRYDEWRERFLFEILSHCKRILKTGGHILLNVKDTRQFPLATDCVNRLNRLLQPVAQVSLIMTTRPVQRAEGKNHYSAESIYVFKK